MNNIKRLREERGMTKKELAQLMNVVPSAVFRWENAGDPKADKLLKLAEIFHCSVDEVLISDSASA